MNDASNLKNGQCETPLDLSPFYIFIFVYEVCFLSINDLNLLYCFI